MQKTAEGCPGGFRNINKVWVVGQSNNSGIADNNTERKHESAANMEYRVKKTQEQIMEAELCVRGALWPRWLCLSPGDFHSLQELVGRRVKIVLVPYWKDVSSPSEVVVGPSWCFTMEANTSVSVKWIINTLFSSSQRCDSLSDFSISANVTQGIECWNNFD